MNSLTSPDIKESFERVQRILSLKPEKGRKTAHSTARLHEGLCVEITEGPWSYKVDLPHKIGGTDLGPSSGILVRGALGSCLMMGYLLWASTYELEIHSLQVHVYADYDAGGQYATNSAVPGYLEIRYEVEIDSPASEEELLAMIEQADKHSPLVDVFSRQHKLKREVNLLKKA